LESVQPLLLYIHPQIQHDHYLLVHDLVLYLDHLHFLHHHALDQQIF
jgi:hypothetical protein